MDGPAAGEVLQLDGQYFNRLRVPMLLDGAIYHWRVLPVGQLRVHGRLPLWRNAKEMGRTASCHRPGRHLWGTLFEKPARLFVLYTSRNVITELRVLIEMGTKQQQKERVSTKSLFIKSKKDTASQPSHFSAPKWCQIGWVCCQLICDTDLHLCLLVFRIRKEQRFL